MNEPPGLRDCDCLFSSQSRLQDVLRHLSGLSRPRFADEHRHVVPPQLLQQPGLGGGHGQRHPLSTQLVLVRRSRQGPRALDRRRPERVVVVFFVAAGVADATSTCTHCCHGGGGGHGGSPHVGRAVVERGHRIRSGRRGPTRRTSTSRRVCSSRSVIRPSAACPLECCCCC